MVIHNFDRGFKTALYLDISSLYSILVGGFKQTGHVMFWERSLTQKHDWNIWNHCLVSLNHALWQSPPSPVVLQFFSTVLNLVPTILPFAVFQMFLDGFPNKNFSSCLPPWKNRLLKWWFARLPRWQSSPLRFGVWLRLGRPHSVDQGSGLCKTWISATAGGWNRWGWPLEIKKKTDRSRSTYIELFRLLLKICVRYKL